MKLETVAISVTEAEQFLREHGRHYVEPAEKIAAIGVCEYEQVMVDITTKKEALFGMSAQMGTDKRIMKLHGAAILGRTPEGDGILAHIYVDGVSQGYSLLYGACWRALKALGYKRAWL